MICFKGEQRQAAILRTLEEAKYMTREQIEYLYFPFKSGKYKACRVLKKMHKEKLLKRKRNHLGPFTYYLDKYSQKADHYILVNWVYCYFKNSLHMFKREYFCDCKSLHFLADALMVLKDKRVFFVEADRGTNRFNKFELYNEYYESGEWTKKWWAPKKDDVFRFPAVLVVTVRKEELMKEEKKRNKNGIRFVMLEEFFYRQCVVTSWNAPPPPGVNTHSILK